MKIVPSLLMTVALTFISLLVWTQNNYPEITASGLKPDDPAFSKSADLSKPGELTILSFNIRDIRGISRTLDDFKAISDVVDEADIVVFQEWGAKGFKKKSTNEELMQRLQAMTAVCQVYLGANWKFVMADQATPSKLGGEAEIPFVAYKQKVHNMNIDLSWKGYYDLGERRDMGLFDVHCSQGTEKEDFVIGSAHTKPNAPYRGEELLKIANYAETHENDKFILLGDFNWGYKSRKDQYNGEDYIRKLHEEGKVFQLFYHLSYNGNGDKEDFRTNLQVRSAGHLYDQFLLCNDFAAKLADGGKLTKDCGFITISTEDHFQKVLAREVRAQEKGIEKSLKKQGKDLKDPEVKAFIKELKEEIEAHYTTEDMASHHLSDHKPIWVQLKLF